MISEWVKYLEKVNSSDNPVEFGAAFLTIAFATMGGIAGAAAAFTGGNPLSAIGGALAGMALVWPVTVAHIWLFIQWRNKQ